MRTKAMWIGAVLLAAFVGFIANDVWRGVERAEAASKVAQSEPTPTPATPDWRQEYRVEADELKRAIEKRNDMLRTVARRVKLGIDSIELATLAVKAGGPVGEIGKEAGALGDGLQALLAEASEMSLQNRADGNNWSMIAGLAGYTNATLELVVHDALSDGRLKSITLTAE